MPGQAMYEQIYKKKEIRNSISIIREEEGSFKTKQENHHPGNRKSESESIKCRNHNRVVSASGASRY